MIVRRKAKVSCPLMKTKRENQMMPASQITRYGARSNEDVGEKASVWAILKNTQCHLRPDYLWWFRKVPASLESEKMCSKNRIHHSQARLWLQFHKWAQDCCNRSTSVEWRVLELAWYFTFRLLVRLPKYWLLILTWRIGCWIWLLMTTSNVPSDICQLLAFQK